MCSYTLCTSPTVPMFSVFYTAHQPKSFPLIVYWLSLSSPSLQDNVWDGALRETRGQWSALLVSTTLPLTAWVWTSLCRWILMMFGRNISTRVWSQKKKKKRGSRCDDISLVRVIKTHAGSSSKSYWWAEARRVHSTERPGWPKWKQMSIKHRGGQTKPLFNWGVFQCHTKPLYSTAQEEEARRDFQSNFSLIQ